MESIEFSVNELLKMIRIPVQPPHVNPRGRTLFVALLLVIFCLPFAVAQGDESERFVAKRSYFLNSIVIPRVDLRDATIREALDFAWARTVELDITNLDASRKGVCILLRYVCSPT